MNIFRKSTVLVSVLLLSISFCFAGELIKGEAVSHFQEGVKAQKEHNFIAATSAYQRTLLIDPHSKEYEKYVYNNFGVMSIEQGDFEKAEAAFDAALQVDPDFKAAQYNLGLVYDKIASRLQSLEYWAKVFNWEQMKPKSFTLQEESPLPPGAEQASK